MLASGNMNNALWGYIVRSVIWFEAIIKLDSFQIDCLNRKCAITGRATQTTKALASLPNDRRFTHKS
jgi:hypothetical protein